MTDEAEAVVSRGRRGKPPTMTEDQIVEAALAIIRSEGVNALSMRRLSRELGRSAMAAYNYVPDKQALLDLVARRVLSEVPMPEPGSAPWDVRLGEVLRAVDGRLRQHTGIAAVLLERMLRSDQWVMVGIIDILVSAGFADRDVFLSYAMIHTYLFGRYQVVVRSEDFDAESADAPDRLKPLLGVLPSLRGQDFFTYGIETIIDGLRMRLAGYSA